MSHFENSLHTFKECGLECTGHITSSEFQFAFVSDFTKHYGAPKESRRGEFKR
jgi:hypothetical protein